MSKPLTTFADPRLAVVDLLRDALDDEVTVGTRLPRTVTIPFLLVASDFVSTRYPADERVTVRVACYAADEASAEALAQLSRAHILSTKGTSGIRATGPLTGPIQTVDPDTGSAVAFYTVAVHTRPVEVVAQ